MKTNNKRVLGVCVLLLVSITQMFAAGNKDVNGLRPDQYDRNGWAFVDGKWVSSPSGAVFSQDTISVDEIFSTGTTYLEIHADGLDINGLRPKDYDLNGWALIDERWVSSPDGALYRGEEHKNLYFSIASVVNRMDDEEKGMLKALLLHGRHTEKRAKGIINSPEELKNYGRDVTGQWVADHIENAFIKGFGVMDSHTGKRYNYGRMLDITIKEYMVKTLKTPKPMFNRSADTVQGAIEREIWMTETFMDTVISGMTEAERLELIKHINEALIREGIDLGPEVITAFSLHGLSAIWKHAGIKPYLFMTKLTKLFGDYILGRTIPWAVYQGLTTAAKRIVGVAFPIVGVALLIKTVYDLPGVINPREFDKFVPAVLLIGISRIAQDTGVKVPSDI